MKINRLTSGSFGKKYLYYSFLPSKNKNNVFFFMHGVYSSGFSDKNIKFLSYVASKLGSVFLYETSRKLYIAKKENSDLDFQDYTSTFKGKSFEEELGDVKILFEFFINKFKNENIRLHIIASSLGGTLSSYLLPKYGSVIQSVTLLGSGISTKGQNRPITNTYPPASEILDNFSKFRGKIILVQGTKDNVVPKKDARKIIELSKSVKSSRFIELTGVDHTFTLKNGKKDTSILKKQVFKIIEEQVR